MKRVSDQPKPLIFVSYCHEDKKDVNQLEKRVLRRLGDKAEYWVDKKILPGGDLKNEISEPLSRAHIYLFLISPDFLDSPDCRSEVISATNRAKSHSVVLVPVILRECAWMDECLLSDLKALPNDAHPVYSSKHDTLDMAWKEIYEGVKEVVDHQITVMSEKVELLENFSNKLQETSFVGSEIGPVLLDDVFVFPTLHEESDRSPRSQIKNLNEIINQHTDICIIGEAISGKTSLAIKLYLELLNEKKNTLFLDLKQHGERRPSKNSYKSCFYEQFTGSFDKWWNSSEHVIVLDNLTSRPRDIAHLNFCLKYLQRVIVTQDQDEYISSLSQNTFMGFNRMRLDPISNVAQEELIKKWLLVTKGESQSHDHYLVDTLKNQVRSVIIDKHIFPRYPYFILAILQTHDASLADGFQLTAYGHAHYVIIMALLKKSGVPLDDGSVSTCLNFAKRLAYEMSVHQDQKTHFDDCAFELFLEKYKETHIINDRLIMQMRDSHHGILKGCEFRTPYIYFYFLGSYLADHFRNDATVQSSVEAMAANSYMSRHRFTLMSLVHHTNDLGVIDEILLRTMVSFEQNQPASLDNIQMNRFRDLLEEIPKNVLSTESADWEREKQNRELDIAEDSSRERDDFDRGNETLIDMLRVIRNVQVLSQILKNKYGVLSRRKIRDIVEEITDACLRIVGVVLLNTQVIEDHAREMNKYYSNQGKDVDVNTITAELKRLALTATIIMMQFAAISLSIREIRGEVKRVLGGKDTRACQMIDYLVWLGTVSKIDDQNVHRIIEVLENTENDILRRVLSVITQQHVNTHTVRETIKQQIVSRLIDS